MRCPPPGVGQELLLLAMLGSPVRGALRCGVPGASRAWGPRVPCCRAVLTAGAGPAGEEERGISREAGTTDPHPLGSPTSHASVSPAPQGHIPARPQEGAAGRAWGCVWD